MQERRTAIRVPCERRMQYCAEDDMTPQDGRLVNLSDRGAGVLLREAAQAGQRVTLSVPLPGTSEPLTATGVVRWTGQETPRHGHPVGLEWFPLDDVSRQGLSAFLNRSAERSSAFPPADGPQARRKFIMRGAAILALFLCGLVVGVYAYSVIRALRQENWRLTATVTQRDAVIHSLQENATSLHQDLESVQTHLAQTSVDVAQLDRQAQQMAVQVEQLTQNIQQVELAYVNIREDRDRLMRQVLDLEQDRTALTKRLSSIEELRQAIRETISARKAAQQSQRQLLVQTQRESDLKELESGNRGYLVREGNNSTTTGKGIRINVHDPQALQ